MQLQAKYNYVIIIINSRLQREINKYIFKNIKECTM